MARAEVFAAVAARRLETSLSQLRVTISAGDFYHPLQLSREVYRAIGRADVVIIDVGAFFVAIAPTTIDLGWLPRWTVAVNDRVRHLRALRQRLLVAYPRGERWVELVETHARSLGIAALRPLVRRYPRPTLQEYEWLLSQAVDRLRAAKLRLVLQGPGGFNVDETSPTYSPDTPGIYKQINAMVRRVAETAGLPMVDRMSIGTGQRSLFLGGTSKYSKQGHRVMGEALAEQLLKTVV